MDAPARAPYDSASTREVALAAKDDRSALPMEADPEGGVRFKRETGGSSILLRPQANDVQVDSRGSAGQQPHCTPGSQWARAWCPAAPATRSPSPQDPVARGLRVSRSLKDETAGLEEWTPP